MTASRFLNKAKVLARIRKLPVTISAEIKKSLAESADDLVEAMRRAVRKRSGKLERNIIWQWGAVGGAKSSAPPEYTITVHIGKEARYYGFLVEFGAAAHVNEGRFAGSENPGFPPEPFFYPTYRARKKAIKSRARRAVKLGIQRSKG